MKKRIIGIGEVLWDMLPGGAQLGGAPANFAYHAQALGAAAGVVSRVGDDRLGREILDRLRAMGLPTDLVQVDESAPTSTVTVELLAGGVPRFTIHEGVAWDRLSADPVALEAVAGAHAVCFGSLAQRCEPARAAVQALVAAAPAGALRVFDINLRQHYYSREVVERSLELADLLKLNDAELPVLAELFELPNETAVQIETLARRFDLRQVALTRGAQGSLLFAAGQWSDLPGRPVTVRDTVGAGDAFTAALVLGVLHGMPLPRINELAGEVARYVCECDGATPPMPDDFRRAFGPD